MNPETAMTNRRRAARDAAPFVSGALDESEEAGARPRRGLRYFWVLVHRYAGLAMAAFLILVGLTGSLLAFYPELERLVHPHWYVDRAPGSWLDAGRLVERLETEVPRLKVQSITWQDYDGATSASVSGATDPASGKPFELGYSYLILDPASGQVLDRLTGSFADGWGHLMGFVYSLHYALALEGFGGWVLGVIALVWTLDCFVGFYLTLPARRRNSPSPPAPLALQEKGANPGGCAGSPPGKSAGERAVTSSISICTAPVACGCGRCCWCLPGRASP